MHGRDHRHRRPRRSARRGLSRRARARSRWPQGSFRRRGRWSSSPCCSAAAPATGRCRCSSRKTGLAGLAISCRGCRRACRSTQRRSRSSTRSPASTSIAASSRSASGNRCRRRRRSFPASAGGLWWSCSRPSPITTIWAASAATPPPSAPTPSSSTATAAIPSIARRSASRSVRRWCCPSRGWRRLRRRSTC